MSFAVEVWSVSTERTSPRGYAFFVPLGGGERPFGFTPTFTGRKYYSKTAVLLRGGFKKSMSPYSFERIEKLHTRLCEILGVAGHERQVVAQGSCRDLRIGNRLCQTFLLQFRSKTSPFAGDR